MKKLGILLFVLLFPFIIYSQESKEEDSLIKLHELRKSKRYTFSGRNPFLKKEEIPTAVLGEEGKQKEKKAEQEIVVPRFDYRGMIISKHKKIALIYIDGVEATVEERQEIMNFKIISIKEKEIEVIFLLSNQTLKISYSGGEQ